jgi:multiple sugar transport system substrate-binding protein
MASPTSFSRRDFLRLVTAGTATAALAACALPAPVAPSAGEAPPPGAEPVTIAYWHIWGGVRTEQLQQVLDSFMEEHADIEVEPLLLPNPGYADKIITGLAGDAPDLTMITTEQFAPSAQRGALRQMDELLARDGISSDIWYSGIWDMTQVNGNTFGIPFVGNFLTMLYWNKADFREGGFDPDNGPQVWGELIEIAESLTRFDDRGNIQNMGYTPGGWGEWMQAVYRNGHDWLGNGQPDQIAIDHPQVLEALQFVMDLYESMGGWDSVGAATDAWGNQQLGNPMIAGVASSITSGVFTVNIINDQAPDLEYAIGHLPHGPNGQFVDVIQNSWNNAIPTRARHPEAAWELAKYLSMGDGHLTFMVEMQARPAMVKEYNEAPYDAKAREENPYWEQVLEILNGPQVSFPVSEGLESAKNALAEAFEMVMLEQNSPEEALAWAQTEVSRIFADLQ